MSAPTPRPDPQKLTPTDVARLLSKVGGKVVAESTIAADVAAGSATNGDGTLSLVAYAAWLIEEVHRPRVVNESDSYEMLKERARARNAAIAKAGRHIGELPAVVDSVRRQRAADSFQFFCEAYFPQTFHLAWSDDHRRVIAKLAAQMLGRREW